MKINDARDTSASPIRLEFFPENYIEEQFCKNLIGIFKYHGFGHLVAGYVGGMG